MSLRTAMFVIKIVILLKRFFCRIVKLYGRALTILFCISSCSANYKVLSVLTEFLLLLVSACANTSTKIKLSTGATIYLSVLFVI